MDVPRRVVLRALGKGAPLRVGQRDVNTESSIRVEQEVQHDVRGEFGWTSGRGELAALEWKRGLGKQVGVVKRRWVMACFDDKFRLWWDDLNDDQRVELGHLVGRPIPAEVAARLHAAGIDTVPAEMPDGERYVTVQLLPSALMVFIADQVATAR